MAIDVDSAVPKLLSAQRAPGGIAATLRIVRRGPGICLQLPDELRPTLTHWRLEHMTLKADGNHPGSILL
jgi:hypothetical protein